MSIVVLIISMLLFFILFFGIGFILNMVLRMSWIAAVFYPIVALLFINEEKLSSYFLNGRESLLNLGKQLTRLAPADMMILVSGMAGAVAAGIAIKLLRKKGYRMF